MKYNAISLIALSLAILCGFAVVAIYAAVLLSAAGMLLVISKIIRLRQTRLAFQPATRLPRPHSPGPG